MKWIRVSLLRSRSLLQPTEGASGACGEHWPQSTLCFLARPWILKKAEFTLSWVNLGPENSLESFMQEVMMAWTKKAQPLAKILHSDTEVGFSHWWERCLRFTQAVPGGSHWPHSNKMLSTYPSVQLHTGMVLNADWGSGHHKNGMVSKGRGCY